MNSRDEAPVDVAALRALCNAATRGPWGFSEDGDLVSSSVQDAVSEPTHHFEDRVINYNSFEEEDDGKFIAAIRTAAPSMLDEIEWLREQLAAEKRRVERVRASIRAKYIHAAEGMAAHLGGDWVYLHGPYGLYAALADEAAK